LGRLFWKVFGFTLLAQFIAALGIGGAIWLKHSSDTPKVAEIDLSPPAAFIIESAASTLQYGGAPALHQLLQNMDGRHEVIAVDEAGKDVLDRTVNKQLIAEARGLLTSSDTRRVVRDVATADGHHYLLFSPALHRDDGFGPAGSLHKDVGPMRDREPVADAGRHGLALGSGPDGPGGFGEPGGFGGPNGPGGLGGPMPLDGPFVHLPPFLAFLPLVSAVLGSLIFAAILAWYLSKPIRSLRSAFEAVAAGDLGVQPGSVMGHRHDELADLGRDFDVMVERLRVLMGGQKRLLHDVSHELRSPLARLQVAIGLARQQPDKIDASLDRIERESMRMDKLVGELLTLSKLEAGAMKPSQDDISVDELLADLCEDARFEAEAHEVRFEFIGNSALTIKGDAELLHSAIENVLRNAIKQTVAGSTVILEVNSDPLRRVLRLSILDRGPGVPDSELQAIFQAFFRGGNAIGRTDGHGLGLAIANRVVAAHHGTISAKNRQGGGLCVEIQLPLDGCVEP
jgi:signal transduction histidine kinase